MQGRVMALSQSILDDWKAVLADDFPPDLTAAIEPVRSGNAYLGLIGTSRVFERVVDGGHSLLETNNARDFGYSGFGTIFIRKQLRTLQQTNPAERYMRFTAGWDQGGRVWAQNGFEIDMANTEMKLIERDWQSRIADLKPYIDHAEWQKAGDLCYDALYIPRGIWAIADLEDRVVIPDDNMSNLPPCIADSVGYYDGYVPLSACLLNSLEYAARFDLQNAESWARVNKRADAAIARNKIAYESRLKAA